MTTLYALSYEYRQAIENVQVMYNHGDIEQDVMEDAIDAAGEDLRKKCINVGLHIKNVRSDLKQFEGVVSEYQAKVKRIEAILAFYENYLDVHMKKSGLTDVSNQYVNVKYRKLPDKVECGNHVTREFSITVPESSRPDKKKIKDFLENCGSLPFARMITDRTKLMVK